LRAVLCTAFDGVKALTIGDAPEPRPQANEVLVDVHAASVSYMDYLMICGGYQMRPPLPYVPGTDAAGIVAAIGEKVERFRPGDRVACEGWHGAFAERMTAKATKTALLPGNAVTTEWPSGHDVVLMSYVWSAVGGPDISSLARRAFDALPAGGLVLIHDFMVNNAYLQPPFAAWYLLGSIFDNPNAVCLTPAFVEDTLRQAGFQIETTEVMLEGITLLTRARKPG
jgi:NADPH:quinone reductase-like Zn-dependent oxidoreductase